MTFNQWASRNDLPPSALAPLEDIWNQIIGAGNSEHSTSKLLDDAVTELKEFYRDKYRRWR